MHRRLAIGLATFLCLLPVACGDDDAPEVTNADPEIVPLPDVNVVESGFSRMYGSAGTEFTYTAAAKLEYSGEQPSGPIRVVFVFKDGKGETLTSQRTRVSTVDPGEVAYPGVSYVEVPAEPASVDVTATTDPTAQEAPGVWVPLTVDEVAADEDGIPTVTGTARNPMQEKLGFVTIACALYREGEIIAAGEGALTEMKADSKVPFEAAGWEPLEGIDEAGCSAWF